MDECNYGCGVKRCCLTSWNADAKSEWKSESIMGECGECG